MEHKKLSEQQWFESLTRLRELIENNAFLEENEFKTFENNCNFVMSNASQFARLPIKDYYRSQEMLTAYGNFRTVQSRYKEALKIADFFQEIADEIKGKRKTKEDIERTQEDFFKKEIQILTSKYNDLIAKFDSWQKVDPNIDKKQIAEYKKKAQKDQKIIEDMVGTVADNANAGRYIKYAKSAKFQSVVWFFFGLFIMVYVASTVFASFVADINFNGWPDILPRILTLFVVLLPAFFMMREAKKQRDKSFQFKDMECRILTSGQFIDSLELKKSEKDALKAQLVKDLFGKPMEYCPDGGLPPVEQICEIIKACLDRKS